MKQLLLVGLGGFIGSVTRFKFGGWVSRVYGEPLFPLGTLCVNLLGCLAIGILAGLVEKQHILSPELRLLAFTGFLGGFTTFSAFGFETIFLARKGELALALANVAASVVLGLLLVWVGLRMVEVVSK